MERLCGEQLKNEFQLDTHVLPIEDPSLPTLYRQKKYHKDDFCMIRPSGNPMSSDLLLEMVSSGDAKNLSQDLVEVNSISIIGEGKVACVVYTTNQYFNFKGMHVKVSIYLVCVSCCWWLTFVANCCRSCFVGTPNEDRVVSTSVVEEMPDGSIKVAHGHRCTGVPIPI